MTLGELERRAGIEQTSDARSAFWDAYSHLHPQAMLHAGCSELRRRIAARETAANPNQPTAEEIDALRAFAAAHGRCWKAALRQRWMKANAPAILHGLRNRLGPSWLVRFRLPADVESQVFR